MSIDRRTLLLSMAAASVAANLSSGAVDGRVPANLQSIKAVAFDAFTLFDGRPIGAACERAFPTMGARLDERWRATQLQLFWMRALAGHYQNFWQATESALISAASSLNLKLTTATRDELMGGYLRMRAWPDVPGALADLKKTGVKLAILSNATDQILNASLANAGLPGVFDHVISTDRIKTFKPDPRAYELGLEATGLRKPEILFVAFADWDLAGATWFGYPTVWNNRGHGSDRFEVRAEAVSDSLSGLATIISR